MSAPDDECPPCPMILVQNTQKKKNHLAHLARLIAESEYSVLCSGWVKADGLELLREAIDVAVQRGASITLYSDHENTRDGVREALARWPTLGHGIATKPRLHTKLYYFERAGRYTALIGSGNITKGGLRTNEELSVQLTGQVGEPQQAQIAAYLAHLAKLYPPRKPADEFYS